MLAGEVVELGSADSNRLNRLFLRRRKSCTNDVGSGRRVVVVVVVDVILLRNLLV